MDVIRSNTADNIYFWFEDRKKGNVNPVYEAHEAYEIYIILQGERYMYLKNELYHVEAGDAMMIPSLVPHRSFGKTGYSGICIEFSEHYIKEHFSDTRSRKIFGCFDTALISLNPDALEAVQRYAEQSANKIINVNDGIWEIIKLLNAHIPLSSPGAKRSFITDLSTIGSYIQKKYLTINGLDELAEHFGVSKEHLCRVFKEHTGVTVTHYINSLKVQYACRLLGETNMPIHEVYKLCGYKSSQYFNRVFKEIKGVTPLYFRKQSRDTKMWNYKD